MEVFFRVGETLLGLGVMCEVVAISIMITVACVRISVIWDQHHMLFLPVLTLTGSTRGLGRC